MNIKYNGHTWKLHRKTPTKLVFTPATPALKAWRQKQKLTQREAAARLGISQGQLARIESGSRVCSPVLLARLGVIKP